MKPVTRRPYKPNLLTFLLEQRTGDSMIEEEKEEEEDFTQWPVALLTNSRVQGWVELPKGTCRVIVNRSKVKSAELMTVKVPMSNSGPEATVSIWTLSRRWLTEEKREKHEAQTAPAHVCWKDNNRLEVNPGPSPKDSRTSWNNRSEMEQEITTQKRYRVENLGQKGTSAGRAQEADPGSVRVKATPDRACHGQGTQRTVAGASRMSQPVKMLVAKLTS